MLHKYLNEWTHLWHFTYSHDSRSAWKIVHPTKALGFFCPLQGLPQLDSKWDSIHTGNFGEFSFFLPGGALKAFKRQYVLITLLPTKMQPALKWRWQVSGNTIKPFRTSWRWKRVKKKKSVIIYPWLHLLFCFSSLFSKHLELSPRCHGVHYAWVPGGCRSSN